jgi:two-component system chemotaxis response regulator CheB
MSQAIEAIAIGGSAGALDALTAILPMLPAAYAMPCLLVLHIPAKKPSYLPEVLGARCALRVKEAEDKEDLAPGTLYVAPPDYHLLVEKRRCASLSVDEPVQYSRPSIDVLFESAADAYGPALAGVLLAGGNDDGARGMARIKRAGGMTLVQTPRSAAIRTMPEAALALGSIDYTLTPSELGMFLAKLGEKPLGLTEAR